MCYQVSSVAIIGSFKQHYNTVLESLSVFENAGLFVTSPKGSKILKQGIPFVRFESDENEWTDEMVQVVALHRILSADFVFTVVPDGYVGRTTCYEIGRIIQAKKPVYFSDQPMDLPLWIPDTHICSAVCIVEQIQNGIFKPKSLHSDISNTVVDLEQDLLNEQYRKI